MTNSSYSHYLFNHDALHSCRGDWVVGFSGGVDSRFLLQLAVLSVKNTKNIRAVYVDHGLSSNARSWGDFCQKEAETLGVAFERYTVKLPDDVKRQGVEQLARSARYEVFERTLNSEDVLLLGHHLSDQAETLLARLIRGSGVNGLSGIACDRQLSNGAVVVRPLLSLSKEQIIQEARQLKLQWIEDESNQLDYFERNYIRQKIMPALKGRWSQVEQSIALTAQSCQQDAMLLDELAKDDLQQVEAEALFGFRRLSLTALGQLSDLRQRNVLRYWLGLGQSYRPGRKVLNQLYQDVILAKADATPRFIWGECVLHRYRDFLWCGFSVMSDSLESLNTTPINLQEGQSQALGRWATLSLKNGRGDYQLCFGQTGIKCRLVNQRDNKSLKKHFQEAGIPPWLRNRWPLLYQNGQLCGIPLVGVCNTASNLQVTLEFH